MKKFNISEEEICKSKYELEWEYILRNTFVPCDIFKKCYDTIKTKKVSEQAILCFVRNNRYIKPKFLEDYIFPLLKDKTFYNWGNILSDNYYTIYNQFFYSHGIVCGTIWGQHI